MNTWVEPPPRSQGLGCFARGCLILLVFGIVLAIACFAGMYWGFQQHSAIVHGTYWLAKTHSIAGAPVPVPEFNPSENQIQSVQERWQDFEQKTRAGQPAEIELTADDINTLIVTNRDIRGKVFVSIDGSQLRSRRVFRLENLSAAEAIILTTTSQSNLRTRNHWRIR